MKTVGGLPFLLGPHLPVLGCSHGEYFSQQVASGFLVSSLPSFSVGGLSDTTGIVWCYEDTTLLCCGNCSVRSGCCGRGEAGDLERTQEGPEAAGCLGADKAPLTG